MKDEAPLARRIAPRWHLWRTILATLLVFACATLSISGYTLWRLRADALENGLEIAAMHSRAFEELLTQSLNVTEILAANTLEQTRAMSDLRDISTTFVASLSHAPYLRSMSLLDPYGRIVASSNHANVGLEVRTDNYLPRVHRHRDILRIGEPWSGRDFAGGRPSSATQPVSPEAPSFIPVTQTLSVGARTVTLLVALNPDYFLNHFGQKFQADQGTVEVLRYDGTLMISTDPAIAPGALPDYVMRDLHLGDVEQGRFEQRIDDGSQRLTAFRASRLYPVVVVTQIRRDYALRYWQSEAATVLAVVLLALAAISLLSWAFYRRQMLFSAQRAEAEQLQRINATVFDSSPEAMLITDLAAVVISINPAFTLVTGYTTAEVIGRPLSALLVGEASAALNDTDRSDAVPLEAQLKSKNGELIWTEILATPEYDARGKLLGHHRICRNIAERKQMEDQVRQLAFYDPLTRLANRLLLNDRLEQAMTASQRSGRFGALLFLDLDNFKPLNDAYGHAVGDLLLREVADRLRSCVRQIDTVARFGGDEFVVMLSALGTERATSSVQARAVAEKVRALLAQPYHLSFHHAAHGEVSVDHQSAASIGVALFFGHQVVADDVIKWADTAMYQAKQGGRNRICFSDPATAPLPPYGGAT